MYLLRNQFVAQNGSFSSAFQKTGDFTHWVSWSHLERFLGSCVSSCWGRAASVLFPTHPVLHSCGWGCSDSGNYSRATLFGCFSSSWHFHSHLWQTWKSQNTPWPRGEERNARSELHHPDGPIWEGADGERESLWGSHPDHAGGRGKFALPLFLLYFVDSVKRQ